jgi:fatty-acyl-CoA synthase
VRGNPGRTEVTAASYSRGPDVELFERSTGDQLVEAATRWPDCPAIISRHQQRRLTWSELLAAADRLAGGLAELGVRPRDRVGIWSLNCWEWVVVQMACARAGAVLVIVNPAYRTHEVTFVLRRSRMKVLFLWERDARSDYAAILSEARQAPGIALDRVVHLGTPAWERLLALDPLPSIPVSQHEIANIQYTSGTTGSPKGVLLTHRNLVNNGLLLSRILRYTERDRICVPVPLSHCFGCVIGTMSALASGASVVLPNWSFEPLATLQAVQEERATSVYGVPTMFIAELRHPEFLRFDLTSLRTGVMAGAPCPIEVMRQVNRDMHCRELTIGYGLTETAPVITMSEVDDDLERRVSTVGKVLPATEIKVASVETGETVPRGVPGEICTRGYMLMRGYDGEPEATSRAIDPDGWFHTGDLGVMREDGYLKITGRAKDMIIRGGENIYPREIEEFLYTHPKIAEVHVTGLPDERLGEIVLAWIRLKGGETAAEEEIREFCRGRIAHFKVPQAVRFVDSFPTTLSGKIQKFRIREIELRERGLEAAANIETA